MRVLFTGEDYTLLKSIYGINIPTDMHCRKRSAKDLLDGSKLDHKSLPKNFKAMYRSIQTISVNNPTVTKGFGVWGLGFGVWGLGDRKSVV